jgi:hypothetical protein
MAHHPERGEEEALRGLYWRGTAGSPSGAGQPVAFVDGVVELMAYDCAYGGAHGAACHQADNPTYYFSCPAHLRRYTTKPF